MCARYTLSTPPATIAELFDVDLLVNFRPRYNIAPTQLIPVIRVNAEGKRECVMLRWGLIPSWSQDASIGTRLLNARSESVGEKPSFREAIRFRRCLVPADGFYEWKATDSGKKQPYLIQRADHQLMVFAGIWEAWGSPEGETLETCAILTVSACESLRSLHDRMPLILREEAYATWLDPKITRVEPLQSLMQSYPSEAIRLFPVTSKVNSARFDDPICVQPIAVKQSDGPTQLELW